MSPPQVNLAVKDTPPAPSVSEEELQDKDECVEKFGPLELPAVVGLEAGPAPNVTRLQRQKARRLLCCVGLILVMVVATIGTMALVHRLNRHSRKHWSCRYGKNRLPEHVKVDHQNHLIRVHHDHDKDTHTPAIEILHEYNRGLVVYKDTDKKICYIDRLDETFVNGYKRWEAYEKTDRTESRYLRVISVQPIEVEVMRHVMDVHVTAHCHDSQRYWVMEVDQKQVTEEMRVIKI